MKFRFLCAGESHGKKLSAIIEGVPANFDIDISKINSELARRQQGYGRGARMKIETDKENWLEAMSIDPIENADNIDLKKITKLRPGHADYSGSQKYLQNDVRNILERSSARETAIRVAIGSIAKQILEVFDIKISGKVISIGSIYAENIYETAENDLNCPDIAAYELMKKEIDNASENGITLGGQVRIEIEGVPVGLGSHVHWDRRLDGRLAQALMSIQAVKSVEIGLGKKASELTGDKVHDEIFYENNEFCRKTNNAGGIEGGISNGETIIATIAMKPIPTMRSPLKSVDLLSKTQQEAHFERSDTCAIPACGVVAEAVCATIILQEFLEKFGGDCFEEISANYNNYKNLIKRL